MTAEREELPQAEVIELRLEEPQDRARWQSYIDRRVDAHCADLGQWRLLFRELYSLESHSYAWVSGGATEGVLSLYHLRSPFMGRMLVTSPFFGYGGFYWDNDRARDGLVERALELARELKVDYLELRLRRELPPPFRANTDFAEFHLEMAPTSEETWHRRISANVRQNIRKSRTSGLEFKLSTDYRPCFALLQRTLRAHGTPFHGERFFDLLDTHLGDRVRYAEVRLGERLVAAGVVVRHGQTILTPYIGSLERYRPLRANYLQYWGLIEHATTEDIRRFDMGRSPRGSTHAQFKHKWGCEETEVYYNYVVMQAGREYRSVSRPSLVQRSAAQVWRRLPLAITRLVGPWLFRYIP